MEIRKLASIQKIIDIQPIENADRIEVATVLGWKVVVLKDEFKIGDMIVFCEIDSLLPHADWSDFLWKKGDMGKMTYRLKTVRMRKQISQGLILPLTVLNGKIYPNDDRLHQEYEFTESKDVTALLGIKKYIPDIPADMKALIKGVFPSCTPKTDEMRIQSVPKIIDEIKDKKLIITEKIDGTPASYIKHDDDFDVCSRDLSLKETENNIYWRMANKYKLQDIPDMMAVQGELAGMGIQKNPLKLEEPDLYIFNVYDIKIGKYLSHNDMIEFCDRHKLKTVPILEVGTIKTMNIEGWIDYAKGKSAFNQDSEREGIVIRTEEPVYSEELRSRLSFKVINNDYLLKKGG